MKKVMIFGIFDGIHEGHGAMIKEAKTYGDYLIVVVAQDHIVEHLTGKLPNTNLAVRFEHLAKQDGVDKVVIGDAEHSTWNIVKRYKPDVVAFANDQNLLKEDFERHVDKLAYKTEIILLKYSEKTLAQK